MLPFYDLLHIPTLHHEINFSAYTIIIRRSVMNKFSKYSTISHRLIIDLLKRIN